MILYIRMVLYAIFAGLAGAEIGAFEASSGTYTVSVDELAYLIVPIVGYAATFAASRIAKARGGKT